MSSLRSTIDENMQIISDSVESIDEASLQQLIDDCASTLRRGGKVIASGLGKNVAICEKFVGTMLSLGLNASFLHTNSAVHGDIGMVNSGDLVIVLTKSGSTAESIYLYECLAQRQNVTLWLLTFSDESILADEIDNVIKLDLKHEGDKWDIVPNNSTVVNLIVLQLLAIELSKCLDLELEKDFKPNHPGGAIGESLRDG